MAKANADEIRAQATAHNIPLGLMGELASVVGAAGHPQVVVAAPTAGDVAALLEGAAAGHAAAAAAVNSTDWHAAFGHLLRANAHLHAAIVRIAGSH